MKKTPNIVMHNTLSEANGVSLNIARFVQYFRASFGVNLSLIAHSAWDLSIESKSNNILLIKVAVSQIEILFSKTKTMADSEESRI